MSLKRIAGSLVLALPLFAGCHADESLKPPVIPVPPGGAMFQRYVSLGNSITAGFQSAGINDSTQKRSYAVLLAGDMGTSFVYPSLPGRGCPPPYINNVTGLRYPPNDTSSVTCDLRANGLTPNNLAVPGARVTEALSNFGVPVSSSNALTFLFLGGRTQIEAMNDLEPTFVSVWLGNNDVLGALITLPSASDPTANPGDVNKITPLALFTAQYDSVLDAIEALGAQAALVSVTNVTNTPYASRGLIYYCVKNGCAPPLPPAIPQLAGLPNFQVPAACAPGSAGGNALVPWPIGLSLVQKAIAQAQVGNFTPVVLDCDNTLLVVDVAEQTAIIGAVTAYNAHIQAEAQARGFAYFDVNPALAAELQSPANPTGRIPAFPNALPAFNNPPGAVTFGPLFTLDGIHPSSLAHELVADSVASAINQNYGTTLPVPVCGTVACPTP